MFCVNFHVLHALSYTFDHIWTNLLTQCTQLPVPVFCCFCISGLPQIKSARKITEKLYKKSAFPKLPENPMWDRRATTRRPCGAARRGGAPGRRLTLWSPPGTLVLPI